MAGRYPALPGPTPVAAPGSGGAVMRGARCRPNWRAGRQAGLI